MRRIAAEDATSRSFDSPLAVLLGIGKPTVFLRISRDPELQDVHIRGCDVSLKTVFAYTLTLTLKLYVR